MSFQNESLLNRCSTINYLDEKFSDLTIINKGKKYHVHKIILCSAIPYFEKMFSSGMKESTFNELQLDHPTEIFDLVMDWIYNRNIRVTRDNVFPLFHLADLMCITDLINQCLAFIFNNYSDGIMTEFEYLMKQKPNEQVLSAITQFVCHNFKEIVSTSKFLSFDFDTVIFMINCSELNIGGESEVFEAICNWISFNVQARIDYLPEFLKNIHWSDIDSSQFINILKANPWLQKRNEFDLIIMAILEIILFNSTDKALTHNLKTGSRSKTPSEPVIFILTESLDTEYKIRCYDIFNGEEKLSQKLRLDNGLALPESIDCPSNKYIINSGGVLKINWAKNTYHLKKSHDSKFSLLFGRVFQFQNKKGGDVGFWKGNRLIELAPIPNSVNRISFVIPHEGYFLVCGYSSRSKNLQIYKMDPQENTWTSLPGVQPVSSFREASPVIYQNQLVLYYHKSSYQIYNLESNFWYQSANFSFDDMSWGELIDVFPFVYKSKLFLVTPAKPSRRDQVVDDWGVQRPNPNRESENPRNYVVSEVTLRSGKLEKMCSINVEPRSDTLMFFLSSNEFQRN